MGLDSQWEAAAVFDPRCLRLPVDILELHSFWLHKIACYEWSPPGHPVVTSLGSMTHTGVAEIGRWVRWAVVSPVAVLAYRGLHAWRGSNRFTPATSVFPQTETGTGTERHTYWTLGAG
ncbi:unnamed protein product [Boreogadus saida]